MPPTAPGTNLWPTVKGVAFTLLVLIIVTGIGVWLIYGTEIDTNKHNNPIEDTAWDPEDTSCAYGTSTKVGSRRNCAVAYKGAGETCTSPCLNTTGYCTKARVCANINPIACKGFCSLAGLGGTSPVEGNSAGCAGKIIFKDYFIWDTILSSADPFDWLYYSDLNGDCIDETCLWSATRIDIDRVDASADWLATVALPLDCMDFLNTTAMITAETPASCLIPTLTHMNRDISTPLFRQILDPFSAANLTAYEFQASICTYRFACSTPNTTKLTDTQFLKGKKRSLLAPIATTANRPPVAGLKFNKKDMRAKLLPQFEMYLSRKRTLDEVDY